MRPNCASLSLWWSQGPWKKNSGSPHYSMAICWSCMKETLPFLNGCFELFMPASEKWGPQQSWFKCMCLSRGVERIEHRGLASNASLDGTVAFPGGHGEPWAGCKDASLTQAEAETSTQQQAGLLHPGNNNYLICKAWLFHVQLPCLPSRFCC